jgi:hypothetical protein
MRYLRTVVLAAAAMLGACGADSNDPVGPGPDPHPTPSPGPGPGSVLQGRAIFGLTCANRLVLFGSGNPGTLVRDVPITGMSAGSVMLGIDFSPAGGALYGIGSDSRVYTIDTLSGAATAVGGSFAPGAGGEHFGISFDANGKLTLQSVESNQQQTLDPGTGVLSSADLELAFAAGDAHAGENPALAASGYYAGTMSSSARASKSTATAPRTRRCRPTPGTSCTQSIWPRGRRRCWAVSGVGRCIRSP